MRKSDREERDVVIRGHVSLTRRRHLWPCPRQLPENAQKKLGGRSQAVSRGTRWTVCLSVRVGRCRSRFESDSRGSGAAGTWDRSPFHFQTSWHDTCHNRYAHISLNTRLECQTLERGNPYRGGKRNTQRSSWSRNE